MSFPRVLIIGDASVGRVQEILKNLDVEIDVVRDDVGIQHLEGPYDLIVATVKLTLAFGDSLDISRVPGSPTWIAVHSQDLIPLRERLRALGVHYLMQTSVSAAAVELLVAHTLYNGPERRVEHRLPVAAPVVCMNAGQSFEANLLDITRNGCRIELDAGLTLWGKTHVELPRTMVADRSVTLQGQILRTEPGAAPSRRFATIGFDTLSEEVALALAAVLDGQTLGTVLTPLHRPKSSDTKDDATPLQQAMKERIVLGADETQVGLFIPPGIKMAAGRELSAESVRLDPIPGLVAGRPIDIAIFGPTLDAPVLAEAMVVADDDQQGLLLGFQGLAPRELVRIQEVIETSSQIESLSP